MTTSHANCDHDSTKADRLACRKLRAEREALAIEVLAYFDAEGTRIADWLSRGATDFADAWGKDWTRLEKAAALLDYFYPATEAAREYKIRNQYIVTKDPAVMLRTILRRNS